MLTLNTLIHNYKKHPVSTECLWHYKVIFDSILIVNARKIDSEIDWNIHLNFMLICE